MGQLTSVAAVVSAAVALTFVAKRLLGNVPWASTVPIWVYTSTLSGLLALIANRVTGTLPGVTGSLVLDAIILGATASGFREWFSAGLLKPMSESSVAVEARTEGRVNPPAAS